MSLHEIDLAQKIADKIICVKGDTISHFGKPEDIFEENMIKELYEINNGFLIPCLEVLSFRNQTEKRKLS